MLYLHRLATFSLATKHRYTRRWLQVLSRRKLVPEKWLAGVIGSHSAARTGTIVARLAEEQRELERYESMRCDGDGLDSEEKVGVVLCFFPEKEEDGRNEMYSLGT